ncbi:MAG: class I SAM-dependent methyltransferase [Lachnospiraceae bacterium]|nr:class I SAM-dependent methyltransferase [Lachnospiraceae bacterium]
MNYLENYYANYDEEGRLSSKHGQVEFLTTMKYIHKFIGNTEKKKILEIGAGTGRYSIALALEGHEVDALEYTTHNLEIMNSKIADIANIRTYQGTALDLSGFKNESFDITLVLGPMYHLYTKEDKQKALHEAIRVTKKQGHIFVAYCMNEATMIQFTFKAGKIWHLINNHMLTDDFRCISEEKDLFEMVRLEEIDELNAQFTNVKRVKLVATDGATNYMRECIDSMDDATFDVWMKYHFSICERMDLIGATNHSLDILQKVQ